MATDILVCSRCGQVIDESTKFCPSCGLDCREPTTLSRGLSSLRFRYDNAKKTTLAHASAVSEATRGSVSPEKASAAVKRMVDVVTYVAQDVKKGMSSDMVQAVTVNARVNFVAFSIGVSIALDKLPLRENSDLTTQIKE
jgi:hypothetical protein